MDRTFGFDTAVEEAQRAAYIEAHSAYHGIGLVKLMGRSSGGFIATHASLSSGLVDVSLIPEVPFTVDGEYGVLRHLEHLLKTKGFCVVCVAEAAGQDLLQKSGATDASGNVIFSNIGVHMQQKVHGGFAGFSGITSCICNTHYVYLPITEVITEPKRVSPNSRMWHRCLTSTGQPDVHRPVVGST